MAFVRRASRHRASLGDAEFPYEAGRYVLYVSYACPWANRAALVAKLKGLDEKVLPVVSVHPTWQRTKPGVDSHCGWVFRAPGEGVVPLALLDNVTAQEGKVAKGSALNEVSAAGEVGKQTEIRTANCGVDSYSGWNCRTLRELYEKCGDSLETGGKFTTPLLFDRKQRKIVNNESSEIILQLNNWPADASNGATTGSVDLYPLHLKKDIDEWNEFTYDRINDGVYQCGFARTQVAYDRAVDKLATSMQKLEDRFAEEPSRAFLVGDQLTIADVRLFQTLVRMDECYVIYFKCYAASLRNFPLLLRYTARIYQMPEVQACTFVRDCKIHYFTSHPHLNAFAVVPRDSQVVELLEQPPDTLIYSKSGASKGLLGFLRDFFTKRIC